LWAGITVAILGSGLWGRSCGHTDERIAQQEVRSHVVDSLTTLWEGQYTHLQAEAQGLRAELDTLRTTQQAGATQVAGAVPTVDTLIQHIADTALADSLQRALLIERGGWQIQVTALLRQADLLTIAVAERETLLAAAQARIGALITDRDQWRDLKTPGRFRCVVGAGGAAGLGGAAAGGAIVCGYTL
jgi:hypothetical protein